MRYAQRHIVLLLLAGSTLCALAQARKVQNRPFIDERRFHYGFTIGVHDQGMHLRGNGYIDPQTGHQWVAENDKQNFGFSVGVLGEWRLSRHLGLRLLPSLHFGSKHFTFRNLATGREETQDMKSTYVSLPLLLKVAAPRFNNYRPYVVAGVNPTYDLTRKKQAKLRCKPLNAYLEVGLGCDFYLPYFKLIPELKFSFGLADILQRRRTDLTDPTQHIFTQSLEGATANMVTLSFYFE